MNDLKVFVQVIFKVIKNFAPAIIFLIVGLVHISIDEGRDKHKKGLLAATRKAE